MANNRPLCRFRYPSRDGCCRTEHGFRMTGCSCHPARQDHKTRRRFDLRSNRLPAARRLQRIDQHDGKQRVARSGPADSLTCRLFVDATAPRNEKVRANLMVRPDNRPPREFAAQQSVLFVRVLAFAARIFILPARVTSARPRSGLWQSLPIVRRDAAHLPPARLLLAADGLWSNQTSASPGHRWRSLSDGQFTIRNIKGSLSWSD